MITSRRAQPRCVACMLGAMAVAMLDGKAAAACEAGKAMHRGLASMSGECDTPKTPCLSTLASRRMTCTLMSLSAIDATIFWTSVSGASAGFQS